MSLFKKLFGEPPKQRTMLDDVQAVIAKLTVKGYRRIAAQHGCAPTAKTSDQKIMEIYTRVLTAFREAETKRGERIPALFKNTIVLQFFQAYEMISEQHWESHLQYEAKRYLEAGLREDHKRELPLFDEKSSDPDVKRLKELQRLTREAVARKK